MKIQSITQKEGKRRIYFILTLEDGRELVLSEEVVTNHYLYPGKDLEEALVISLVEEDSKSKVRRRAVRLLDYRAMSSGEMVEKLVEKGEERDQAEDAAQWLVEVGLLDDASYAENLVQHYAVVKGFGKRRIEQELWRRKIDKSFWENALATIPEDAGEDAVLAFIERKLRGENPDQREEKRVVDALMRRGYSWDEIRSGIRAYKEQF